jgi:hypothetical protein
MKKTFTKIMSGILPMLVLLTSGVSADEEPQTPTANLLPNARGTQD